MFGAPHQKGLVAVVAAIVDGGYVVEQTPVGAIALAPDDHDHVVRVQFQQIPFSGLGQTRHKLLDAMVDAETRALKIAIQGEAGRGDGFPVETESPADPERE